jgi:hypothetical protein
MPFTLPHIGIVLTIIGTIFLALSVKVESPYEGDFADVINNAKKENPDLSAPLQASIDRVLFWVGLIFIALGALCQW